MSERLVDGCCALPATIGRAPATSRYPWVNANARFRARRAVASSCSRPSEPRRRPAADTARGATKRTTRSLSRGDASTMSRCTAFLLDFATTAVATLYHYAIARHALYPLASLPVALGTVGGIGLLVGPTGLLWFNLHRHPNHDDPAQRPLDRGFIAQLDRDRAGSSSVASELPSIPLIWIKPPA